MQSEQDGEREGIRLGKPDLSVASVECDVLVERDFPIEKIIRWTPRAEIPYPAPDVDILVSQEVLVEINAHVSETFEDEIGGFLLGNRYRCPIRDREYVIIDRHSPAKFTEATSVSLSFPHDAWARLAEELEGRFGNKKLLIGWYHSHPRMDVFLSSFDVTLHDSKFGEPWQPALVITPDKDLGGFFCRCAGMLDPRGIVEFFECLDGADAQTGSSVVRWRTNYQALDRDGSPVEPRRSSKTARGRAVRLPKINVSAEKPQPFPEGKVMHWVPVGESAPSQEPFLLVTQSILREIYHDIAIGAETTSGFLLGNLYRCPNSGRPYLTVDEYAPAPLAANGANSVFAPETWKDFKEGLGGKFLGKNLVGWYQSGIPITETEEVFRAEPDSPELASESAAIIMVDPSAGQGVVLRRRSGKTPVVFYELRDFGAEGSVISWTNYRREDSPASTAESHATNAASLPVPAASDRSLSLRTTLAAAQSHAARLLAPGRNRIYAAFAMVAIIAVSILSAHYLLRPRPPAQSTSSQSQSAEIPLTPDLLHVVDIPHIDPKLVDPGNPRKGVMMDIDLQSPPAGFDLSVGDTKFLPKDYRVLTTEKLEPGVVRVRLIVKDNMTMRFVENRTGDGSIPIEVIDPSSGKMVGAKDFHISGLLVRLDDDNRKAELAADSRKAENLELAKLRKQVEDLKHSSTSISNASAAQAENYKRQIAALEAKQTAEKIARAEPVSTIPPSSSPTDRLLSQRPNPTPTANSPLTPDPTTGRGNATPSGMASLGTRPASQSPNTVAWGTVPVGVGRAGSGSTGATVNPSASSPAGLRPVRTSAPPVQPTTAPPPVAPSSRIDYAALQKGINNAGDDINKCLQRFNKTCFNGLNKYQDLFTKLQEVPGGPFRNLNTYSDALKTGTPDKKMVARLSAELWAINDRINRLK